MISCPNVNDNNLHHLIFSGSLQKFLKPPTIKKPTRSLFQSPSKTIADIQCLAVPLSPLRSKKTQEKKPLQISRTKHTVSFRSLKLADQLLPIVKALANGSIRKALTLLLNSPDVKEDAKIEIRNVIDRECRNFCKHDVDIQLRKQTSMSWKALTLRKFSKILKSIHHYYGLVLRKQQHQHTAKHLIALKFVQLCVF